MIPPYIKKSHIAKELGISACLMSVKVKTQFSYRDKHRIAKVYETIIEDLTRRIKEIRE